MRREPLSGSRRGHQVAMWIATFATLAACSHSTSTPMSRTASGSSATGARAFSGHYLVTSTVTSAGGGYGETVGTSSRYAWTATPSCASGYCAVNVRSSTGSTYRFTFSDGAFHGLGHGTVQCYNTKRDVPTGQTGASRLSANLVPIPGGSPIAALRGTVHLATRACTAITGTGTFDYVLTRTGPPAT
jgi:hypothetical protein